MIEHGVFRIVWFTNGSPYPIAIKRKGNLYECFKVWKQDIPDLIAILQQYLEEEKMRESTNGGGVTNAAH
jgi:hypothetical protein